MLQAKTKEQKKKVLEIFGIQETCCHFPLDYDKETDWGYEECDDRIYLDGDISFDTMAEIVDYLRGQKSIELPSSARLTVKYGVSEVNLKKTNPVEAKEYILSLGSMGFNTEELMQEYIKHGIIHCYGQK